MTLQLDGIAYEINSEVQRKLLEAIVRERALRGTHVTVRTEHRIRSYFADIYLEHEGGQKLVIECDGHDYHSSREDKAYDAERDRALLTEGYITVRFTGRQVHQRANGCAQWIFDFMERWPI